MSRVAVFMGGESPTASLDELEFMGKPVEGFVETLLKKEFDQHFDDARRELKLERKWLKSKEREKEYKAFRAGSVDIDRFFADYKERTKS